MATTIQKYIYALFSIIVLLCSCDPLLVPQSGTQAYEEDANGHKYVDLGLSVKWAAYDIGAKSAAEHGSFFAWGETQPKDKYSWENYKYAAPRKEHDGDTRAFDDEYEMTKYNIVGGSEYYDGKTTLELMDDAAHMAWGGNWRMPTADECDELLEKCEWTWTEYLGMGGYDVKGPNGNRIFLPELEIGQPTPQLINTSLYRWSSSVLSGKTAYRLDGDGGDNAHYRCEGLFVRAVWGKTLPKFFILSFDANGGEGLMHPQQFNKGVSQSINAVVRFTHESLNFVGWNTEPDGSGQSYANGEKITLSKDMTLYAQWALVTGSENGHDYVDLGLPSGLKWATCNVGATSPEGYGNYYAWGETSPKSNYTWETYKFRTSGDSRDNVKFNKYNTSSDYGTIDNKTTLDLSDDAARANWGGSWRTPTRAERNELTNNCTWTWTTQNGVNGYKVTSKTNGNSIFLPAAGRRYGASVYDVGSRGYYWSSSLYESYPHGARYLYFGSDDVGWYYVDRYSGHAVRAVFSENDTPSTFVTLSFNANGGEGTMAAQTFEAGVSQAITANTFTRSGYTFTGWNTNADGSGTSYTDKQSITISQNITLYAQWESAGGSGGGSSTSGTENGHDYVDLGLPSGLKWATCNVGATTPEGYGDYFAWGETSPKNNYVWSTYKYCNGSAYTMTKYCTSSSYGTVDNKTTLEASDDAAQDNWGGKWRMPTSAEQDELQNNCTWTWTTRNGVNGYKVTSKTNGNSIFLPAAGYRHGPYDSDVGSYGYYWSSSLNGGYPNYAYGLYFDSGDVGWSHDDRDYGRTVRAVCP